MTEGAVAGVAAIAQARSRIAPTGAGGFERSPRLSPIGSLSEGPGRGPELSLLSPLNPSLWIDGSATPCYQDGMTKKTTTVRMPEDLADTVEVFARGRGISVNALVIDAATDQPVAPGAADVLGEHEHSRCRPRHPSSRSSTS